MRSDAGELKAHLTDPGSRRKVANIPGVTLRGSDKTFSTTDRRISDRAGISSTLASRKITEPLPAMGGKNLTPRITRRPARLLLITMITTLASRVACAR